VRSKATSRRGIWVHLSRIPVDSRVLRPLKKKRKYYLKKEEKYNLTKRDSEQKDLFGGGTMHIS
jgi:hypothetical protein